MLKKIAIAVMLIIPMGIFAQNLKFGHVASQEIIVLMPEYAKAQTEIQALDKTYSDELRVINEEITKKYQEFQQAMQDGSLPANIQERRQKEIQDLMEKSEQFQQDAYQKMQEKQQELLTPILQKAENAVKEVGQAEGFIYIFDLSRTYIPYINENQSTDVTAKVKAKLGL